MRNCNIAALDNAELRLTTAHRLMLSIDLIVRLVAVIQNQLARVVLSITSRMSPR
jgi:hypothetical protein